ncbi:membrane alanine aminopeptidase N [Cutibacterium acnes JCM 18918]|nr:membrane alanine aminopeptidase N [Cutibacterium acnes JCM 18918]
MWLFPSTEVIDAAWLNKLEAGFPTMTPAARSVASLPNVLITPAVSCAARRQAAGDVNDDSGSNRLFEALSSSYQAAG